MNYVPFVHTHRAIRDGIVDPFRASDRAVELGIDAIMFAGLASTLEVKAAAGRNPGVRHILGECFRIFGGRAISQRAGHVDVFLFPRNPDGELSLNLLSSMCDREQGGRSYGAIRYVKLKHHIGDLGCVIIPENKFTKVQISIIARMASAMPGSVWYGLSRFGIFRERQEMPSAESRLKLEELGLEPVAYNPACRVYDEDLLAQKMYIYDQNCRGNSYCEPESISDSYIKTCEEMEDLFADCPEAIEHTLKMVSPDSPNALLKGAGIETLMEGINFINLNGDIKEKISGEFAGRLTCEEAERIDYELECFKKYQSSSIVMDIAKAADEARESGFIAPCGPLTSSMVHHLLGSNPINPAKYGLLQEFYTAAAACPSIEVKLVTGGDPAMITDRAIGRIGKDRTSRVITYKGVNRKRLALECHNIDSSLTEKDGRIIFKHIKECTDPPSRLKYYVDAIRLLEGCAASWAIDQCKIVASPTFTKVALPVFHDCISDAYVTLMYDKELLKSGTSLIDVSRTKEAVLIGQVLSRIQERTGSKIDIYDIPMDESAVFDLICEGKTKGLHMIQSERRAKLCSILAPRSINELAAFIAATDISRAPILKLYMENRTSGYKRTGTVVDSILEETSGVMVYFEQLMLVLSKCAGYTIDETVEAVDRLLFQGMPDAELIGIEFEGCPSFRLGHPELARVLSDYIASYGRMFSTRSASIADAVMCYQMAWLKYHYPGDFRRAMSSVSRMTDL